MPRYHPHLLLTFCDPLSFSNIRITLLLKIKLNHPATFNPLAQYPHLLSLAYQLPIFCKNRINFFWVEFPLKGHDIKTCTSHYDSLLGYELQRSSWYTAERVIPISACSICHQQTLWQLTVGMNPYTLNLFRLHRGRILTWCLSLSLPPIEDST